MVEKNYRKILTAVCLLLSAALLMGGCSHKKRGNETSSVAGNLLTIPSKNVEMHFSYKYDLNPTKAKGLYAVSWPEGKKFYYPGMYGRAAKKKMSPPRAGQSVTLIGKLPGSVDCTFQPKAGIIKENKIRISVNCSKIDSLELMSFTMHYVVVRLPVLPSGKYSAEITFKDYQIKYDKAKLSFETQNIGGKKTFVLKGLKYRPLILTCNFEVPPIKVSQPQKGKTPVPTKQKEGEKNP